MKTQEKLTGLLGCCYPKTTLCCLTHRAGECSICSTACRASKCHSSKCTAWLVCAPTKKTCRMMVVLKTSYMKKERRCCIESSQSIKFIKNSLLDWGLASPKLSEPKTFLLAFSWLGLPPRPLKSPPDPGWIRM